MKKYLSGPSYISAIRMLILNSEITKKRPGNFPGLLLVQAFNKPSSVPHKR